jgi:ligand-binding sensor domain-containing protein/signal transduction histidine kinase
MIRSTGLVLGMWLLLLGGIPAATALDPHQALDHFGQRAWRTEAGLPENTVHSILQARNGYLWLGTDGGLVRFDGVDFLTFDTENTPQFASDSVYDVFEDTSGTLWIATAAGLVTYCNGRFSTYTMAQGLPADTVWLTHEDAHHRLWALTAAGPAWLDGEHFSPVAGTQAAVPLHRRAVAEDARGKLWLGGSSGLFSIDLAKTSPELAAHLLPGQEVAAVVPDQDGLWVGGANGLDRYANGVLTPMRLPHGTMVTALSPDAHRGLWAGTTSGLLHLSANGTVLAGHLDGNLRERIDSLFLDREGSLWISTEHGAFRLTHGASTATSDSDTDLSTVSMEGFAAGSPLAINRTLAFYEDREGSLWLGTDSGGLHLLHAQKFTTYTTRDGLSGNYVRSVWQSAHGDLWVGTDGEGLNRRAGAGFVPVTAPLSSNVVLSLADAPAGDVWVGTPNGLNRLRPEGAQRGSVKTFTSADGLPDDFIRSLYTDQDGSLWVGTRHGLAHWSGNTFTSYSSMDGLASDLVGALLRAGPLWIGTSDGLSRLEGNHFTNDTMVQGLSNNTITAIARDHEGTLWLGTNGGGLNRLQAGKIFAFPSRPQGLPGTIYGILEDGQGRLWLSSKTGIFAVSLADLNAYAADPTRELPVAVYGTADGMNIREASGDSHPSAWKATDGRLWFATLDGVSVVDPEHMPLNRVPPPVVLEQVLVDDQERAPGGELDLQPGAHRLEFRYAGLSFVAPQRVRYRYRLEGFDHDWVDAGSRRSAFYTNLSPGRYRFRVMAANNDGVWNTGGASLGLRLRPHFYQTWWFYTALALMLGGLGYLVYRWRVLEVEARWAAVLRERSRIAREIHDTLAQGFVGISVQLELMAQMLKGVRTPGTAKPEADQIDHQIEQMRAQVQASLADARTSIWDLRSAGSSAQDLPARMSRTSTQLAAGSSTKVYLQVKGTYRPLARKMEEELLRIGQEAVANALRHARATRVDVELVYAPGQVSLHVDDDGCGFLPETNGLEGHYGLRGMRERAQEIAAALSLDSAPGAGTRVRVEVPLDRNLIERAPAGERKPVR